MVLRRALQDEGEEPLQPAGRIRLALDLPHQASLDSQGHLVHDEGEEGFFVGEIPVVLNLRTFAISILINLIVLLVFTFIPVSKVLRIKEAEAIRWGYERYQYKPTKRGESFPTYLLIAYRRLIRSKKKLSLIVIMLIIGSSLSFGLVKTSNSLADKIGKSLDDGVDLTVSFRALIKESEMMKIKNISGVENLDPSILLWIHRKNITISYGIYNGNPPSIATTYYVLFFLKRDRKVFSPDIIEGRLPLNANEIALLPKIALFLGIKVGDKMEIKIDSLNISIKAKVVGIVNEMYQNGLGFIFLDEVMYNAGAINEGYYNVAFIKLEENANIDEVIKDLMDFGELNIASIWIMKDLRKMINELVVKSIVVFLTAISTMVIVMSIIGMGLFFFMSYVSRLKEISLFISLGASIKDIGKIMLSEGLILYLLSIIPTIIIGFLMPIYFVDLINKSFMPVYGVVTFSILDIILLIVIPILPLVVPLPMILIYISRQDLSEHLRTM